MKRLVVFAVLAVLVLGANPVSADWKNWLKARVPEVKINVPNLTSKTRRTNTITANGNGVRSTGATSNAVLVSRAAAAATTAQNAGGMQGNGGAGEVIIVPPNASREAPNFLGVTVAINWFKLPARIIRLENNIQKELAKRGASFVYRSDPGSSCNIGQPVICFVVQRPVAVASGSGYDSHSNSRRGRSSSGSSSGTYGEYVVIVRAYLVKSDGSAAILLGERTENFAVTGRYYESFSSYSSGGGRRTNSSGSSSYSLKNGELAVLSEAARQAEGEIKYLLKEKSDESWTPGAAELVEEAFRR